MGGGSLIKILLIDGIVNRGTTVSEKPSGIYLEITLLEWVGNVV
jgi:hypothetical protein